MSRKSNNLKKQMRRQQSTFAHVYRIKNEEAKRLRKDTIMMDLREVVDNLSKIAISPRLDRRTWCIQVEFDALEMTRALRRGGDDEFIEYIADDLKYKIMDHLRSINIQRPGTLDRRG
jgi:hypothetical protein